MARDIVFSGPMFLGPELEFVPEGHVIVRNGIIAECGEGSVDGAMRKSIIPAFFNAHTHVGDYFLRERALGLSPKEACGKNGVKDDYLSSASDEVVVAGMRAAITEMMRTGTCGFADFREGGVSGIRQLKQAMLAFRMKGVQAKVFGRPHFSGEDFLDDCDGYGVRNVRAEHVTMRCGRAVGVHCSLENMGELERALEFKPDFLVHMNSASADELDTAASKNIPIALCARSNDFFGLQLPNIESMLELGITLMIGTDNAMVNTLSVPAEMEFIFRKYKGKVPAREILKMATVNPAKVFGFSGGYIARGMKANLLFCDEGFLSSAEPYTTCVTRINAQRPMVMIDGKFAHL